MNLKKIPKYVLIALLTLGASLILGLLSFAGMYAVLPFVPVAAIAFALAVAYEGEIYWQNVKGAVNKLTKNNYLKNLEARKYLVKLALKHGNECQFYQDYIEQLRVVSHYQSHLDKESKLRKEQAEKKLRHMEKWFATLVFDNAPADTDYAQEVLTSINKNGVQNARNNYLKHKFYYRLSLAFATVSGVCMGVGIIYLLLGVMPLFAFMATLPPIAVPVLLLTAAALTGSAYAFLIYNTLTNMINHDTIGQWLHNISQGIRQGKVRGFLFAVLGLTLLGLAITLTVFTAGTWWTIAQHSPIISLITGLSALAFNVTNTSDSVEVVQHAAETLVTKAKGGMKKVNDYKESPWQQLKKDYSQRLKRYRESQHQKENWLQRLNPFRLVVTAIVLPLRIILFAGHIISMAATADQFPGVPHLVNMLIGGLCDGFEDLHMFFGDGHHHHHELSNEQLLKNHIKGEHSHNHDNDIPTRIVKALLFPIYVCAATWDWGFSKRNDKPVTFTNALKRQYGMHNHHHVDESYTSLNWQKQDMLYQINKHQNKNHYSLLSTKLAKAKKQSIQSIKQEIIVSDNLEVTIENARKEHYETLMKHRHPMPLFKPKLPRSAQLFDKVTQAAPCA